MRLVDPVVVRPLKAEWAAVRPSVAEALARSKRHGDKASRDARAEYLRFLDRMKEYRVLDPACGSGNFLYLALGALKNLEHEI
ncbi:DNA methyltransferase, partial [Salmonella enterica]|uniref:DNA methyltransferase n=1 Tax=Salmonella enterica TaxID=28901 RepID=UPI003FA6C0AB